ncbi:MAG: hypothetical protein IJ578_02440 [Bacteroidales bacterium]|nr:hypothetical protein [Bacteroidales bacterium]
MSSRRDKIFKVVTILVVVAIVFCALWIMAGRQGLVSGYDFGAGAYYYADIPGYEKIVRDDVYQTKVPYWIHVVLFLGWGWLMYRLWVWIDKRK